MNKSEVKEQWELRKLKELWSKITDGTHITPKYLDDGIPFLRVTDIPNKEIQWSKTKKISREQH